MYLKQIFLKNCGPIDETAFNLSFDKNGNPKPLILVGENGSGKSILVSYIVDALHEFFIKAGFKNLIGFQKTSNITFSHLMYKLSGYFNKKLRTENAFSALIFNSENDEQSSYLTVQDISINDAKIKVSEKFPDFKQSSLPETTDMKIISDHRDLYKKEHEKGCFIFFPDYRQEQSIWMNEELEQVQPELLEDKSRKPLLVISSQNENASWLLDILLDCAQGNPDAMYFLNIIKNILQKIMKREDVFIANDSRKLGGVNRITIGFREQGSPIPLCPRINALSEGQATLLNTFLTILRYADVSNIKNIENISGVVIIEEIENHLHEDLLANVVPELINLFPKIQFIITTHSPIFLLGMNKIFGCDGFDIREMPSGLNIKPEDYSQFQIMFDIISNTEKIRKLIESYNKEKELIITEGQTDWMHMKHAFNKLDLNSFQFLEYTDTMGGPNLKQICQTYSKIPHTKPIICIFDSDDTTYLNLHRDCENEIKNWGNNVYSFCIPIPDFRKEEVNIYIEMYYPDNILKMETTIDQKIKCLYFNNELSYEKNNYHILDFPDLKRMRNRKITDADVDSFKNPNHKPFIKTKKEFATEVINDKIPNINYTPFQLIYDKIAEIIDLSQKDTLNNQN